MSVLQWLKILWHTGKNKPPNIITNNTNPSLSSRYITKISNLGNQSIAFSYVKEKESP